MTKSASESFDAMVASAKPALRPICVALRRKIAALHSDRVEIIWPRQRIASFGIGPRKMSDHYAYIAVYSSHVNLGFYHGAALTDRAGVLEGVGKKLRHIKMSDVSAVRAAAVSTLLRLAIAERMRYARESAAPKQRVR